ncbi:MAG: DUF1109 family protein [Phreatobacter sp.]|uniref:NrsF family protein n=1 Tax=Phreatobacter sp. TaxID=1966341 RepID=UPI001A572C43|nr:NrsF family protein [Phreatobacter sp.]MBL8570511.1 DUF1109 family protein [Phreatobacter sp.]
MKTEDLIAGLARDAKAAGPSLHGRLMIAAGAAATVAFALMMLAIGTRPDLASAMGTVLFGQKLLLVATLAVAALALLRAAARPEADLPKSVLVLPALIFLFGMGHEVATQPAAVFGARLVGNNSALCLVAIPLLAAAPLAIFLAALRNGAPQSAMQAGALAGFAAGTIAAFFYGLHCADDSPFFVATWYTIGIALTGTVGALLGRRMLAW